MQDAWHWLIFLIGGGGISTILVAWFGWRSKRAERIEQTGHTAFTDGMAFERLAMQMQRLGDLIERAIEKYDLHLMIQGIRHDQTK